MKRRGFTLFISLIVLWASLTPYSHRVYASDVEQYRPSSETVCVAIAPKLTTSVQESTDHLFVIIAPFALTRSHSLHQKILSTYLSICKSVKAYIVFRVFRN
jgi:hypothetical protein